jgi:hypothetical protein
MTVLESKLDVLQRLVFSTGEYRSLVPIKSESQARDPLYTVCKRLGQPKQHVHILQPRLLLSSITRVALS